VIEDEKPAAEPEAAPSAVEEIIENSIPVAAEESAENIIPAAETVKEDAASEDKNKDRIIPAAAGRTDKGTPNGGSRTVSEAPADNVTETEVQTEATISSSDVPMAAPAVIADAETPLSAQPAWALINLILTILTGITSAVLLAGYFGKKEDDDENEDGEEKEIRRKGFARLSSIIPAAASIIAFVLTENMSNPMVLTDRWTILMAVILLLQAVPAVLAKKATAEAEEEETPDAVTIRA
jgi:hypothetical protein